MNGAKESITSSPIARSDLKKTDSGSVKKSYFVAKKTYSFPLLCILIDELQSTS